MKRSILWIGIWMVSVLGTEELLAQRGRSKGNDHSAHYDYEYMDHRKSNRYHDGSSRRKGRQHRKKNAVRYSRAGYDGYYNYGYPSGNRRRIAVVYDYDYRYGKRYRIKRGYRPSVNHIWVGGHWRYSRRLNSEVWVRGHWAFRRDFHRWVDGHYRRVRGQRIWVPGCWTVVY